MVNVIISDEKSPDYYQNSEYFEQIDQWAQQNCASYHGYYVQDVSDATYEWDELACYQFLDERDATWFKLRWL